MKHATVFPVHNIRRKIFIFSIRAFFLFLAVFCFGVVESPAKAEKGTICILPFQINAAKSYSHLQEGLQKMLALRMKQNGFKTVPIESINKDPVVFSKILQNKELVQLGNRFQADWVVKGSMTQIGDKGSIDLKVVDVSGKKIPFFIFQVVEDLDEVPESVKRLALSVEDRITGVPQVDAIYVAGNRRIEKAAILAVVGTQPGDRLDLDKLDQDLRDIYKMGYFNDVTMDVSDGPSGKVITFNVVEKPSVGKIVFVGNDEYDDEDLNKELGINLYSILDYNAINQSVNRLRDFYKEKGYYNAEIKETTETLPNNEVMLKYNITENDKVYILKIEFKGNKAYDDDQLEDLMETNTKWFLSWITKAGLLDKKKLEFDAHKITSFYHNHGYIKAKVGDPKVHYDDKIKGLVVSIDIHEGERYDVDKVNVAGDLIEPADELLKSVDIGKEKVFNRETVRTDMIRLQDIYANQGYAYSEIRPIIKENDESHTADITYQISKGPKVRFERITITGNQHTRDKVIRRELKVMEGDYFSSQGMQRSTENLRRLGFFEDVQFHTKKGSRDDLMDLNVDVKEKGTRTFSVGAGYSSAYSSFVTFQVADENFMGYGQRLSTSARIGGKNTEFDIRFLEPWLFDTRLSLGASIYKFTQEYTDYTRSSYGTQISLGAPLYFDYTRGTLMYAYDHANISDVSNDASYIIRDMTGTNVTSSLTLLLSRDSRDRTFNTTRGSINELSVQYAGGFLQGTEEFTKYRGRSAWFFPMFWNTVFMVQGRAGYIQDRGTLSSYQKFFLGGINTVRGYDYNTISPIDPETGDYIGGETMMVFNVEYHFPLLQEQGVIGIVFFDAGNAWDSGSSNAYDFGGLMKSAGAGVRWFSPLGPLRLEYGWKLDEDEDEGAGKWEFSIGGTM
ncbi:outer membrane protein assembly complex, YaeT protein [delta proteobacterium NaphS2]|nr:outer membrane protein assembly complex, YaeT protein [delta proteobacterium NaphS2]